MSRSPSSAAVWSAAWFLAAPGVVAGLVPGMLAGWQVPGVGIAQVVGLVLVVPGVAVIAHAFAQFVVEGRGTPMPAAPTQRLVVGGLYRWVRNPMYLAVLLVIGGQALLFEDLTVVAWGVGVFVTVWLFVVGYEQPRLRQRYGRAYVTYCENVPGWYPRLTPWRE